MKSAIERLGAILLVIVFGGLAQAYAGTIATNLVASGYVQSGGLDVGTEPGPEGGPNACIPAAGGTSSCLLQTAFAASFTATETHTLGGIAIPFELVEGTVTSLQLSIATSSSGAPGTILEVLNYTGTLFSDDGLPHPLVEVNSVLQPLLVAGTTYWLIVDLLPGITNQLLESGSGGSDGVWGINNTGVVATEANELIAGNGSTRAGLPVECGDPASPFPCNVWTSASGFQENGFVISDTALVTTPEPSGFPMLAIGVVGLAALRKLHMPRPYATKSSERCARK